MNRFLVRICSMIVLLSACVSLQPETPIDDGGALQTAAHQTVVAAVNQTETASTASVPLTATGTPPSAIQLMGPEIRYNGISFSVHPLLDDPVFLNSPSESPKYTEFSFAPDGSCDEIGCVTVYPVQEFSKFPWGSAVLDELKSTLETGATDYFPTWGAGLLLRAQSQPIPFQSGRGIRAVVERAQMGVFVNNEMLVYDFHGMTEDGQYYVRVIYPLAAPMLLSSYDPAENTNPDAIPVPGLAVNVPLHTIPESTIIEYNQEAQRQLELLDSIRFIPDLNSLDELVGSLRVHPLSGN